MIDKQFKKEAFKESVKENVKFLYRKTLEEATQEQIFQAVSYTVKDVIIDNWLETQNAYQKQDPKIVYYMSMEFLMGRALGNNLLNLTAYGEVKEALEELGLDLNVIEDQEPDPALGNGGLGRLAACFLDSLATLNYCAYGCGIRYRYGMFKQKIENGFQIEAPDNWLKNGYEFLMGRALGNNLLNLTAYGEVKEALEELGLDLNVIEDQEPDPALGNGGLGRLAACFLDSLATLNYCAYGCGIRYGYGMFKQEIKDGFQLEVPDNWLKNGYPFELRRPEYAKEVHFGGYVRVEYDPATGSNRFIHEGYQAVKAVPFDMPILGYNNKIVNTLRIGGYVRVEYDPATGSNRFIHEGYQAVKAVPFDMPILGYNNKIVNTLRIWDAEPIVDFGLDSFDKGDYKKAVEQENLARNIVEVLYPNDNHMAGKELRLKQQYFFVSASLQAAIEKYKKNHSDIRKLYR